MRRLQQGELPPVLERTQASLLLYQGLGAGIRWDHLLYNFTVRHNDLYSVSCTVVVASNSLVSVLAEGMPFAPGCDWSSLIGSQEQKGCVSGSLTVIGERGKQWICRDGTRLFIPQAMGDSRLAVRRLRFLRSDSAKATPRQRHTTAKRWYPCCRSRIYLPSRIDISQDYDDWQTKWDEELFCTYQLCSM